MTVTASNTAELVGISYSDPIRVDLTPPIILNVNDGGDRVRNSDNSIEFFLFHDRNDNYTPIHWICRR